VILSAHSLFSSVYAAFPLLQALELDPKYVKAWAKKGDIEFVMKEYHKALESYQKGLALEDNNALCRAGLQKTLQKVRAPNAHLICTPTASTISLTSTLELRAAAGARSHLPLSLCRHCKSLARRPPSPRRLHSGSVCTDITHSHRKRLGLATPRAHGAHTIPPYRALAAS
jgi:tetratricopeptide (TPR) repeat protein